MKIWGETQWFLHQLHVIKIPPVHVLFSTERTLSHVVSVRNYCVSPIPSYLIISALIILINPNLFIVSLIY
jgi:hypothetical protein